MNINKFKKLSTVIGIMGTTVLLSPQLAFAAGTGYAAPTNTSSGSTSLPADFSSVVISTIVQPSGGTLKATVNGQVETLTIPNGTFNQPVQVTITAPQLSQIGSAGFTGYSAISGAGVFFSVNGNPILGTFAKSVSLTIQSSALSSNDKVVEQQGNQFSNYTNVTTSNGSTTINFNTDPAFAVLAPTVTGATSPSTGKPFIIEGILAGALILGGSFTFRRRFVKNS